MTEYQYEYIFENDVWVLKRRREVKHTIPKTREYTDKKGKKHRMPKDDYYEPVGEWEDVTED
jgi:hypothetical protein